MKKLKILILAGVMSFVFNIPSKTNSSNNVNLSSNNGTDNETETLNSNPYILNNSTKSTLTFDANGGTIIGEKAITVYDDIPFSSYKSKIPNVKRDGCKNDPGWYYIEDENKIAVTDDTKFSQDTTLYANWFTYKVTFNAGDGQFSDGSKEKSFSDVTYIHSDEVETPTLEGSDFTCWKVNNNSISFPYIPSGSVNEITVYASYNVRNVTLAFNSKNGHFSDNTKTKFVKVPYGTRWSEEVYESVGIPLYPGSELIFSKWQYNGKDLTSDYEIKSSILLTACYEDSLTVTFNVKANNGQWTSRSGSDDVSVKRAIAEGVTFGQFLGDLTTTCKDNNYELLGWFDTKDAENDAFSNDKVMTSSMTVYAFYKVPFNLNVMGNNFTYAKAKPTFLRNERVSATFVANNGYDFTKYTLKVKFGEKEVSSGYTFEKDPTGDKYVFSIERCPNQDITIDLEINHTIYKISKLNTVGVERIKGPDEAPAGNSILFKALPKTGYKIKSIIFNYTEYPGDILDTTMLYRDCAVEAKAEQLSYTIATEKDENIESISVSKKTAHYNDKVTVDVDLKSGYAIKEVKIVNADTLDVFSTSKDKSIAFQMPAFNIKIIATSTLNAFDVTFNSNGGSEVPTQKIMFNEKATEPETPKKEGYYFGGWFTSRFLTEESYFDFTSNITSNITLYAKWCYGTFTIVQDKYNVEPDAVGGGNIINLKLKIGEDIIHSHVNWSSGDERIATVDNNGVLTALGPGHCIITASYCGEITWFSNFESGSFSKFSETDLELGLIYRKDTEISGTVYIPSRWHNGEEFIDLELLNQYKTLPYATDGSFKSCTNITSVDMSDEVYTVAPQTFNGCSSLKSIILSNSLSKIDDYAFYDCVALESIHIPASVTSIGSSKTWHVDATDVFKGCTSLELVIIESKKVAKAYNPGKLFSLLSDGKKKVVKVPNGTSVDWFLYNNYTKQVEYNYDVYTQYY